MRGAAEVKHANLLAFLDVLPFVNGDLAGRDLGHADRHHAHQADVRVVRLDEDQRARRHRGDVALRVVRAGGSGTSGRQADRIGGRCLFLRILEGEKT